MWKFHMPKAYLNALFKAENSAFIEAVAMLVSVPTPKHERVFGV